MSGRPFPHQRQPVPEEQRRRMDAAYPVFSRVGQAPFGSASFFFSADAGALLEDYYSTPVASDDVWIVSLPKSGTTWTQEMVWLIKNDCDYAGAQCLLCPDRYQFLDIAAITAPHVREEIRLGENPVSRRLMFASVRDRPKPWFVKTHLPLHFCPPSLLDTAKVIYVARNPRDVCVSYLNHLKVFEEIDPNLTIDEFADLFIDGEVSLLPFFPHVLEAWNLRHKPNLLFLFFEDLKRDLRGSIKKVADFLGKTLTEDQLDGLELHLSFNSMKNNQWVNKSMAYAYSPLSAEQLAAKAAASQVKFMRKGETGDWKNHFSKDTSVKMEAWIERELAKSDLKFVNDK